MARRVPPPPPAAKEENESETANEIEETMIPEAKREITTVDSITAPAREPEQAPDRYRVMSGGPLPGGSWPILYGNVRATLPPGKIVDSNAYDIGYLKRQGVSLEKIA